MSADSLSPDRLPDIFYRVNPDITDDELKLLHSEILARMLREHEDLGEAPIFSTMEKIMIERFVSFYIFMREHETVDIEAGRPIVDERKSKEMMKVWVEMAAQLHKQGIAAVETDKIKQGMFDAMVGSVARAVDFVIKDPVEAASIKEALHAELLDFVI